MNPKKKRRNAKSTGGPTSGADSQELGVRLFLERHRTVARLVMAIVFPLLFLGTLELGLRVVGYGFPTRLFIPVPDTEMYGANVKFGRRFFPAAIARKPLLQSFDREKAENTCRIFVLGGSAAAGIPGPAFSMAQILDVLLPARYPGVRFEVINAAITATNSHVVLPIARECVDYDPDLLLVYTGNNEVIGPFGIGASRNAVASNLGVVRFGVALQTTRIGQLIKSIVGKLSGGDDVRDEWGGMAQYSHHLVTAEDPELAHVHDNFRRNLVDICRAGNDAEIPVVLSTVAVNLRDCPPFVSLEDTTLSPAALAAWRRAFQTGIDLVNAGHHAAARDSFLAAAAVSPYHAETHYRLGQSLLALGDTTGAQSHFLAALEYDVLRFRADQRLNDIIRATAAAEGAVLADGEAFVRAHEPSGTGLPGAELFFEHVHPTFPGNHLLARAVLPAVEAALPERIRRRRRASAELPDVEECARVLAYTPWDQYNDWSYIYSLVIKYPFTAQFDHAAKIEEINRRLAAMRAGSTPEQARSFLDTYRRAWSHRSDDPLLGMNFAKLLAQVGSEEAARDVFNQVMATQPPQPDKK